MTPRQTGPIITVFDDPTLERVRVNHEQRLAELQAADVQLFAAIGRLLNFQVLINSGVYTKTVGTTHVLVEMQGGGGGGGGTTGVTGIAGGAGGNSGWYSRFFLELHTDGVFVCGAGAAGTVG